MHRIALHCFAVRRIPLQSIALPRLTVYCNRSASHRIASHRIASQCIASHCIALHCIALPC
eukprot:7695142-Pyramimonas_sp.AAC.1